MMFNQTPYIIQSVKARSANLICLLLIVSVLAIYCPLNNYQFINFDDDLYVVNNRYVQNGLKFEGLIWAFTSTHASNWHPLTWLSHMADVMFYGMDAGKHHITNVLFHIVNTVLLFLIMKRMTGKLWRSAAVASLFALHPLNVESVAWLAERKNVLCTFFGMLTIWNYLIYVEQQATARYLLVAILFILGLMAKPMIVTLPFLLLLLDYWPLNRFASVQNGTNDIKHIAHQGTLSFNQGSHFHSQLFRLIVEKTPLLALTSLSCIITFWAQNKSGAVISLNIIPFHLRVTNIFVSYIGYIEKMIWPANLAIPYPYPATISLGWAATCCILLVLLSFLVFKHGGKHQFLIVGWLWYVGTLVPVIGFVQVGPQSMADRYTYIPLIGLYIIIAWGGADLFNRWRCKKKYIVALTIAVLASLAITSWKQVQFWKNSITLFTNTIEVTSGNYLAHDNLGAALAECGNLDEAIEHYLRALLT